MQVVATGGLSYPAMGTDGVGMRALERMGHNLHAPYPALTPLRGTHAASQQLSGALPLSVGKADAPLKMLSLLLIQIWRVCAETPSSLVCRSDFSPVSIPLDC